MLKATGVRDLLFSLEQKDIATLDEYFAYHYYYCHGNFRNEQNIPTNIGVSAKITQFLTEFGKYSYDKAALLAYPNTYPNGEREELNYHNIMEYLNIPPSYLISKMVINERYSISDLFLNMKDRFKDITGDELSVDVAKTLDCVKSCIENTHTSSNSNVSYKFDYDIDTDLCRYYETSKYKYATPSDDVHFDYHAMKQQKRNLENYPNSYLTKKLLRFAYHKFIINLWEYNFYMDILAKPRPRKLSQRQAALYKSINRKVRNGL